MTEKLKALTMEFERKKKLTFGVAGLVYLLFIVLFLLFITSCSSSPGKAPDRSLGEWVVEQPQETGFPLIEQGKPVSLLSGRDEDPGVDRVLAYFANDLKMVSGEKPSVYKGEIPAGKIILLAGTLGKSELLDRLISQDKIKLDTLKSKREMFLIQLVDQPFDGVGKALVVAGSDKRGTIYGLFELSKQMGVSPWYWWADVPVEPRYELWLKRGVYTEGEPAVSYRGVFLNDEEPALGRWAVEKFGGFNSGFYEKLFELLLRMKGNFIWPAMWWASFNTDDPMNPVLANELGIVVGTSHHEPMNRAWSEWKSSAGGDWNYKTNSKQLKAFWTEGIERTKTFETVVTLAMRGDGDEAMSRETNVALLKKIVNDQRLILSGLTGKELPQIPQVWALYKEVQDYYDQGMTVPDDVTLLFCDDNWGNIRRLPRPDDPRRSGGYGMYYHFDYVGGPRNYKWVNTTQIERVWEQMTMAYHHGVDRLWVVNVGDLKPMEFPINFFLDLAWDPTRYQAGNLFDYTRQWAEMQFGKQYAETAARLISQYTRFNSRRKPELLEPGTYSLSHYDEAMRVVDDYDRLTKEATSVYQALPASYKDAWFQLVQYPVEACANLNEMYVAAAQNRMFAEQGRVVANELASRVESLYEKDSLMAWYYNTIIAGGKWHNMMNQTHIGYSDWQQPPVQVRPETDSVVPVHGAEMGVAISGSEQWWPGSSEKAMLPEFDPFNRQCYALDIFNRGDTPFEAQIEADNRLIRLSSNKVQVVQQTRIRVEVNWQHAPAEVTVVPITITGPGGGRVVIMTTINPMKTIDPGKPGYVGSNGYLAIETERVNRIQPKNERTWQIVDGLGRTKSSLMPVPQIFNGSDQPEQAACAEYDFQIEQGGPATVHLVLLPTQNIYGRDGLRIAVAINNEPPQIINLHNWQTFYNWGESVKTNSLVLKSDHQLLPGLNTLKIWALDPGTLVQRILIDAGGLKPSYLGPPESYYIEQTSETKN